MAHPQQADEAVFPARKECPHVVAAGVLPTAPDTGERATGERQGEHVEELLGELEHLRGEPRQVVVEALDRALHGFRHLLGGNRAEQHHRQQRTEERQVGFADLFQAARRFLRRTAGEAGGDARGGEEGAAIRPTFIRLRRDRPALSRVVSLIVVMSPAA